jgi:hypothetical protein
VDALEWLVGFINDIPEIIPKDFPWQNLNYKIPMINHMEK